MLRPAICFLRIATMWCAMSVFVAAHAAGTDGAPASEYPVKPIRIVVGFSPGGGGDIVARIVAQKLSENLKQSMIVDNRPGAGGSIGAAFVARSAPDGYTLLVVTSSYAVIPSLYKELSFDPIRDLAAVSLIAEAPLLVVVHPSLPVHAIRELIAFAKARPGQLNYASGGSGTSGNLAGELFKSLAGVNIVHVPYKGAGLFGFELLAGHVDFAFTTGTTIRGHFTSGKLKGLAVTSTRRTDLMPELPTMAEAGLPGYEVVIYYGLLAPAGTPANVLSTLGNALLKSLEDRDIKERIIAEGAYPAGGTPMQFAAFIKSELVKYGRLAKQAGLTR